MSESKDSLFELGIEQRLQALEKRHRWPDAFASMVRDVTALAQAEQIWMTLGLVGVVSVVVFNAHAFSVEKAKAEQKACAEVKKVIAEAEHNAVVCSNACGRRQENYDRAESDYNNKWKCFCRPNDGSKSVSIW